MAGDVPAEGQGGDLEQQTKRLAKLWDAYEKQEKEIAALKDKVAQLEAELADRERINRSLKDLLETRDRRSRELEIEITGLRGEKATYDPKMKGLETDLRIERERFAKLFALAEELEEEIKQAKKQVEARDEWFRESVGALGDLQRVVDQYQRMVTSKGKAEPSGKPPLEKLRS